MKIFSNSTYNRTVLTFVFWKISRLYSTYKQWYIEKSLQKSLTLHKRWKDKDIFASLYLLLLTLRAFTCVIFIFDYDKFQTVLIIETVLIFFSLQTLPLYWSYNRVYSKKFSNSTYNRDVRVPTEFMRSSANYQR